MLEQLLSSGGGYQDQVHGIVPGIKTVRSNAAQLPLVMTVENLELNPKILKEFEERIVLAFTGKTRLAKNILQNVLRRWARRTDEIVAAMKQIVSLGEKARDALSAGDFELFGKTLYDSATLKVTMTGEETNAQPEAVRMVVADLMSRKIIDGACLCGAGGGGFIVMMASKGYNMEKVKAVVQNDLVKDNPDLASFTFHGCRVSEKGLTLQVIEDENIDLESFDLSWQCSLPN